MLGERSWSNNVDSNYVGNLETDFVESSHSHSRFPRPQSAPAVPGPGVVSGNIHRPVRTAQSTGSRGPGGGGLRVGFWEGRHVWGRGGQEQSRGWGLEVQWGRVSPLPP